MWRVQSILRGQARNEKSPFEFVDMSVKEPWKEDWKEKCKTKIKSCDGVIVMVSGKTCYASGAIYEMRCANEASIPMRGIYISSDDKDKIILPAELKDRRVVYWTWPNIKAFVDSL